MYLHNTAQLEFEWPTLTPTYFEDRIEVDELWQIKIYHGTVYERCVSREKLKFNFLHIVKYLAIFANWWSPTPSALSHCAMVNG